jgi:anti-sigma factor ChrR (cupin superfamily)
MNKHNMDFNEKLVIETYSQEWSDSPSPGVKRIPLEREAKEHGHTTSIVSYDPGASFTTHGHPQGEEIFVLEGTFSDENGDYPAGTYLRNPPGSSHAPFSKDGCKLLVKLNQFDPDDDKSVVINTNNEAWHKGHGNLSVMPLHSFRTQGAALVKWPKGEKFIKHSHFGGEEVYVLKGEFIDEHGTYPVGTWLRSPHLSVHEPFVNEETIIFVKTGHISTL